MVSFPGFFYWTWLDLVGPGWTWLGSRLHKEWKKNQEEEEQV